MREPCVECGLLQGHKMSCGVPFRMPTKSTAEWHGIDPSKIDGMAYDPVAHRLTGETIHGKAKFDMPLVTEVLPGLWQGGCMEGLLLPPGITHVISLYPWERWKFNPKSLRSEMRFRMVDHPSQDLGCLDSLALWVNACRRLDTGDVLVHCQAGLNRSSIVIARALFLAGDFDYGPKIVEYLRTQRSPAVLCNETFEAEVMSWGRD